MKKTILSASFLALLLAPATQAQDPGVRGPANRGTPQDRPVEAPRERPKEAPERPAPDADQDAAKKRAEVAAARLRTAFSEAYLTLEHAAAEELAVAREAHGDDATAFAAARAEIARKYRGQLATLRSDYAEKAKAEGVGLALPEDPTQLMEVAKAAAPEAALRLEYAAQVAELSRAAQREVSAARDAAASDPAAFANQRNEIARKYRGQVVALQQLFAQRASGAGIALDTSDASAVMEVITRATPPPARPEAPKPEAPKPPSPPAGKPADAGAPVRRPTPDAPDAGKPDAGKPDAGKPDAGKPDAGKPVAPPPTGGGKPLDADVLRKAYLQQVDTLRTSLAGDLAAADASLKGPALATKRAEIVAKYRGQLTNYRANVAARAQAAGVELTLPTDAELVPELADATPPPAPGDGTPPKDAPKDQPKPAGDGATPPKPADPPTPVGPGGKRGRGPRFGGG